MYQTLFTIGLLIAGLDFLRLGALAGRRRHPLFAKLVRLTLPVWVCWLALQLVVGGFLVRSQTLEAPHFVTHMANAVGLAVLLPVGLLWQRMAGMPTAPLMRAGFASRRLPFRPGDYAIMAAAVLIPILGTVLLFGGFRWSEGPAVPDGKPSVLGFAYIAVTSAFHEEALFRGFLLARLMAALRRRSSGSASAVLAIAVTTALFVACHQGLVEPAWLKVAQMGILGIALGLVQVRIGFGAAVLVHLMFNAAMPAIADLVPPQP